MVADQEEDGIGRKTWEKEGRKLGSDET